MIKINGSNNRLDLSKPYDLKTLVYIHITIHQKLFLIILLLYYVSQKLNLKRLDNAIHQPDSKIKRKKIDDENRNFWKPSKQSILF